MNERVSIICTAAGNSEGDAYLSKRQNDWRDSPPYDRGWEGATSPRLPNRASGFPAHGSPVAGFLIGSVSPVHGRSVG